MLRQRFLIFRHKKRKELDSVIFQKTRLRAANLCLQGQKEN